MTAKPVLSRQPPEDWSGEMGERWLKHLAQFEGMIAPIGLALLQQAGYREGERVIDIGCGGGATTLEIGQQVGGKGSVLGLDLSSTLVTAATGRAAAARMGQVSFRCGDAATAPLEGPAFGRLFSRFGLMFFPDPYPAFAHLRTFLTRGGRADFCVWAPPRENQWIAEVMALVREHAELPETPPRTPGPFALCEPDYTRDLLTRGGFTDIGIERWQGDQLIAGPGATAEEAADFIFKAMSFGRMLESGGAELQRQIRDGLGALFRKQHDGTGVRTQASAWLVRALA